MRLIVFVLVFTLSGDSVLIAQENEIAKNYGNQITPADLKEYLSIIASDALEGERPVRAGKKWRPLLLLIFITKSG